MGILISVVQLRLRITKAHHFPNDLVSENRNTIERENVEDPIATHEYTSGNGLLVPRTNDRSHRCHRTIAPITFGCVMIPPQFCGVNSYVAV